MFCCESLKNAAMVSRHVVQPFRCQVCWQYTWCLKQSHTSAKQSVCLSEGWVCTIIPQEFAVEHEHTHTNLIFVSAQHTHHFTSFLRKIPSPFKSYRCLTVIGCKVSRRHKIVLFAAEDLLTVNGVLWCWGQRGNTCDPLILLLISQLLAVCTYRIFLWSIVYILDTNSTIPFLFSVGVWVPTSQL